jgi:Lrp/AsnC family transcriptional regulator, regulator for asnA, asnC and gidA
MARSIDDIDHAIIACLQHDSRTPSAEIARRVGVAERTVRARIDRLVQDGVVRLVALVSPQALGYTVTADVFLEVELGRVQEVAEHVANFPEVTYVGLTTGDRDISLQMYSESVDSLYTFVTERLNRIPGVLRARTFVIPRIVKSIENWSVPDRPLSAPIKGKEKEKEKEKQSLLSGSDR